MYELHCSDQMMNGLSHSSLYVCFKTQRGFPLIQLRKENELTSNGKPRLSNVVKINEKPGFLFFHYLEGVYTSIQLKINVYLFVYLQ